MVRKDDDWQKRQFKKWTDRNLIPLEEKHKLNPTKRERLYQTNLDDWSPKACVCGYKKDHKSSDCKTINKVEDGKKILSQKRLCFNCTGVKIEQLSVAAKEPVKHVKVNIIPHFVNSQIQ